MMKRSVFLSLAAGLACAVAGMATPARAATAVISDQGTGTANVAGTATGATITSLPGSTITNVNGLPTTLSLSYSETITAFTQTVITSGPFSTTIDLVTAGNGTKTISDGTNSVTLTFTDLTGNTVNTTVFGTPLAPGSTLSTVGRIVNVTGSASVGGFNFYTLLGGISALAVTRTTGPQFTNVVGHAGTSATASGFNLIETAVPEPTSMALLGIGMTSFLAFRRFFKRSPIA